MKVTLPRDVSSPPLFVCLVPDLKEQSKNADTTLNVLVTLGDYLKFDLSTLRFKKSYLLQKQ